MAYSHILQGAKKPENPGLRLTLVDHMYYPDEAGTLIPPQNTVETQTGKPGAKQTGNVAATADTVSATASRPQPTGGQPPATRPKPAAPPDDKPRRKNKPQAKKETRRRPAPDEQTEARPANEVVAAVRNWAEAWSRQDYDAYIGYYTHDFPNDGRTSREQWLAQRKVRLTHKDWIKVEVISPEVTRIDNDNVHVTFIQTYDSPSYSDKVRKSLLMRHTDGGWRIAHETSTLISRRQD